MDKTEIKTAIDAMELAITAEFVPWSTSRNAKPAPAALSDRSLNWRVTLSKAGREVLTSDYSAGIAHCPSYKQLSRPTMDYVKRIEFECERGREAASYNTTISTGKRLEPDMIDVLYSLSMDADVLDAGGFEDWARDFGYDTDSRKAEAIYGQCLDIALKLRSALGDAGLTALRQLFQDY